MPNYYQKVIENSWYDRMKYTTSIFKNDLLIIKQTLNNSKILINNLINLHNRLAIKIQKRT